MDMPGRKELQSGLTSQSAQGSMSASASGAQMSEAQLAAAMVSRLVEEAQWSSAAMAEQLVSVLAL